MPIKIFRNLVDIPANRGGLQLAAGIPEMEVAAGTITLWIQANPVGLTGSGGIFWGNREQAGPLPRTGMSCRIRSAGSLWRPQASFRLSNNTQNAVNSPSGEMFNGDWWFVAIGWNVTQTRVYLNDQFVDDTLPAPFSFSPGDERPANLGNPRPDLTQNFDGRLADVRAYSRRLSHAEVMEIYVKQGGDLVRDGLELSFLERGDTGITGATIPVGGISDDQGRLWVPSGNPFPEFAGAPFPRNVTRQSISGSESATSVFVPTSNFSRGDVLIGGLEHFNPHLQGNSEPLVFGARFSSDEDE